MRKYSKIRAVHGDLDSQVSHLVQPGDSFTGLALKYYGSWNPEWKVIAAANGYPSQDVSASVLRTIQPGQILKIPAKISNIVPAVPTTTKEDIKNGPYAAKSGSILPLLAVAGLAFILLGKKGKR